MDDKKYLGFLALLIIPIYFGYDYLKKKNMKITLNRHLLRSNKNTNIKATTQNGGSSKNKKVKTKKYRKN